MDLRRIEGGVMWKTPVTNNQAFVHIKSIGRYDTEGQLVIGRLTSNVPLEICIFQRPGQYTEGEAESHRLSPRLGGATPLLPLSPRYISPKENSRPWQRVNSATAPASVYDRSP